MLLRKYLEWESSDGEIYPIIIMIEYDPMTLDFGIPFYESEYVLPEKDIDNLDNWLDELNLEDFFECELSEYYNFNIDENGEYINGK